MSSFTENVPVNTEPMPPSWRQTVPILALMVERRSRLARVVVAGIILSVAIALLIPARYESTVQLMPPDQQSLNSSAMLSALAGGALPSMGAYGSASSL
jgi:uncharacterized protein involved in exopolysaccharide biosynthesis